MAMLTEGLAEKIKDDQTYCCEYPPQFYLCKDLRLVKTLEDYYPLSLIEQDKYEVVAFEGQKQPTAKGTKQTS